MQAARLATRLQRELSMLQSDPPFGICVWPSENKLNHLEAQLQGPEGTVYAKGMFRLEIQVPDRYPFEPPCVRFKTSIYHPNVDTGGRICLDLLTMPPKGSWKPSLNISTLLTSIGLLLAEPNSDDGLMSDITAEYKHNRPSFDMKARSWTEKYASENQRDISANVLETGSFAKIASQQGTCTSTSCDLIQENMAGSSNVTGLSDDLIQENMAGSNVTGLLDETLSRENNYENYKFGKLTLPQHQVQKRMKLSLETNRSKSVITCQGNMASKSVESTGLSKHQNTSNEGMCSSMRAAVETSRNSSIISNCESHMTSEYEGMEGDTSQSGRHVELIMETNTQGVDDVKGKRLHIYPGVGTSHKETNRTSPLKCTAPQNAGRYKGVLCKKLTTSMDKLSKCDASTDVQTSHIYELEKFSGGIMSLSFMSKVPGHSLSGDDIKQATSKQSLNEPGKPTVAEESNTEPMECQKVGNAYSDITCIVVADSESEDDKPVNPRSRLSLRQKSLALRRKPQFKLQS